jgi:hypothetical protein
MSFQFFDTLFPSTGGGGRDLGYVVLALFPEGRFDPASGPVQSHYFAWPSQREDLVAFCLHNEEKDIYTTAALFKERGNRRAGNIAHQWAVYADADDLPLAKVRAEPTMVVETSPGRHHLYWITAVDDVKKLTEISRSIAHTHAADGCDTGGWDAGQLLRVPGTTNNKRVSEGRAAFEVRLTKVGQPYGLGRLADLYPPVAPKVKVLGDRDMPPKKDWYMSAFSMEEATQIFHYNPDIYEMFFAELREGQDRSATMWRLLCDLARSGCTRNTAMYIAWDAKCNKYKIDGRPEEELWAELCRAYAQPGNQPVTTSLEAVERTKLDASEANPENKVKDFLSTISILREEERPGVPGDTFVDEYAEWAATRTDAPDVYHRAGALTLLTSIFGEFGSCPTKFDSNLTLWFLLLGPTTRARKTTAMMLWVDLLGDLQSERYTYLLGSDVTSEALSIVLPKRDGRTSVFFRDEAHGLLYEQDKKRYLAGLREHMTELYGGRVRIHMRASNVGKDDDDEPKGNIRTNFVMFLCGTLDQVTGALTIEDYQSGHLARFLVAEADPPPMTEEDMYIEQYDGVDRSDDVRRVSLMNNLDAARAFWANQTPPGKTRIVPFSPDAWHRLQKAKWEIYRTAKDHEMAEVLLPTVDRMGTSVMKTAVLLAMAERFTQVEMRHVLKAMFLAEEWYGATARIVGRIMHSSWSAQQEEVLTMVRSRIDGVTQQEIYSRFRTKLQEKDIESIINVLLKAGMVRKIIERGGRIRYIRVSHS